MAQGNFIERRKEPRLPYDQKILFTDGQTTCTAYAANISRGGIFAMSLNPFPIQSEGYLLFCLPNHATSLCFRAKVAHIVFDRQRCEIENGMGFQFMDLTDQQKALINVHILNEKATYQELKEILAVERPNAQVLELALRKMPMFSDYDLLKLRYKVNRICTIFEPTPETSLPDAEEKTMSA